jgi:hypothetical protein
MANKEKNQEAIGANDIVFECPHCTKSLAIDCRGAGLAIRCPDCGGEVTVPIPAGVDITDLDRLGAIEVKGVDENEDQTRMPESRDEMRLLMSELEELRFRRRYLEKQRAIAAKWVQAIQSRVDKMRTELDQIEDNLKRLREPAAEDTQDMG